MPSSCSKMAARENVIGSFDFADHELMRVKLMQVKVAEMLGHRAWCNWMQVKDTPQMLVPKRVKILDYVISDCGFVTGNSHSEIDIDINFNLSLTNFLNKPQKRPEYSKTMFNRTLSKT